VKQAAIKGDFEKIPAEVQIKHLPNLLKLNALYSEPKQFEEVRGVWIYGPSGCGKTTFARTEYSEDVYIKAQNKWWDGYHGQKTVVLDDLDSDCLSHYLKIWADKWAARGEIKGGQVALNYEHFIVTSNFSIEELFRKVPEVTLDAIKRRFKEIRFPVEPEMIKPQGCAILHPKNGRPEGCTCPE